MKFEIVKKGVCMHVELSVAYLELVGEKCPEEKIKVLGVCQLEYCERVRFEIIKIRVCV